MADRAADVLTVTIGLAAAVVWCLLAPVLPAVPP
jgi:hypothetical protein